jgi:membrane-bound metal-dependent hydrolase YbcI (DUF457 family)
MAYTNRWRRAYIASLVAVTVFLLSERVDTTHFLAHLDESENGSVNPIERVRHAMWPPGHVAVAYVCLSVYSRLSRREPPAGPHLPWLVVGALAPDLVDKPLAWSLGVLPGGRTLAHSLLGAVVVVWLARRTSARLESQVGLVFGVGYLSHLLGDTVLLAAQGDLSRTTFLLWPLVPAPADGTEPVLVSKLSELTIATLGPELVVGTAVVVLWLADGAPGAREVGGWVRARRDSLGSESTDRDASRGESSEATDR